jgi:hypothetical protein
MGKFKELDIEDQDARLAKYKKNGSVKAVGYVVSSVSVTKEQKAFIERENLNLSLMVRDMLDALMRGGE